MLDNTSQFIELCKMSKEITKMEAITHLMWMENYFIKTQTSN